MGTFSFKSSGLTQAQKTANALVTTAVPVGILTPPRLAPDSNGNGSLLVTSFDLATQLADNYRNLLQTNWGERLGLYDFGANLRPLLSDLVSLDDFDAQAISRIKNATERWMPYVDPQDFLSNTDATTRLTKGIAQVTVTVTYDIPSLNVRGKKVRVTLYAI